MREKDRSYVIDLSEPTALAYFNGAIVRNPRGLAVFLASAPRMLFAARGTEGCLQAKAAIAGPREFVMFSYWRDHEALRRFYTSPLHVRLMRLVFDHPDWYTLYNETYRVPESVRYWNAVNGYGLSQSPRTESATDFFERTRADPVAR